MLGLLLKDIYNIKKQAIWYLAMIVLFCGLSIALKKCCFFLYNRNIDYSFNAVNGNSV